jgi:predicted flap endonuclease-1-like 5' DNA nuclease
MATLEKIEGIGSKYAKMLREIGVPTTNALLEMGSTPKGRKEIAERSGISGKLILEWVNHVDLFRIDGVGEEFADLLEEGGVDTIRELARRNPANLYKKIVAVNEDKNLVRRLPSDSQVDEWVAQAKKLPRIITY